MAYSPSPGPSSTQMLGNNMQLRRLSATPPLSQPISKRDKRRNATLERLNDINASFNVNREAYSRIQLNSLSRDMNYISRADLYQPRPLDDNADEIYAATIASTADNNHLSVRGSSLINGLADGEPRAGTGKWSAIFIQEINNAMEERDAQLTETAIRYQEKLEAMYEDHRFAVRVAEEEHKILEKSIRERVIQQVIKKKNQMLRDKEHLDIADTNALLLHPSQFSITHPASPGGAQNNRKTRHTRHKLEFDELEKLGESNKRKRKAAADFDNGSPGPPARASDPEHPTWDKAQGSFDFQQHSTPLISVERLFNAKELGMATQLAVETTAQVWNAKPAKAQYSNGRNPAGLGSLTNGDGSDAEGTLVGSGNVTVLNDDDGDEEDGTTLGAPEMDRIGSQSMPVTRSTRNLALNSPSQSTLSIPNVRAAARLAAMTAIQNSMKTARLSRDTDQSIAAALNPQEVEHDLVLMGLAASDESRKP